jgi:hypothetical protein
MRTAVAIAILASLTAAANAQSGRAPPTDGPLSRANQERIHDSIVAAARAAGKIQDGQVQAPAQPSVQPSVQPPTSSPAPPPRFEDDSTLALVRRALPPAPVLAAILLFLAVLAALFALWYQLTPEPRLVDFPRHEGERHLWTGTPRRGLILKSQHVFLFVFGLAVFVFAYNWVQQTRAMTRNDGGVFSFFPLFGLPFGVLGACLAVGPVFVDARRRRMTTYALTNQRVIISRGSRTNSCALDRIEEPELLEHLDGTGSITLTAREDPADFEKVMAAMKEGSLLKHALGGMTGSLSDVAAFSPRIDKHGNRVPRTGGSFERIQDAQRVYEMLLEAMAPARVNA